ncbi:XRE family transcriptional regulator [Sphaerisporangium album]|uniref:XRE family transcriptional regulator n=1 Tax=Sphaerisporangium album TaxID=509200 RepID=A0A367EJN2_9ACTN|nr:helix-turn-helix transcriptional regulator [Sphaerisporangium album]RCG17912.1 XRE family transcriptional regulator [Sphaerisporangium album]
MAVPSSPLTARRKLGAELRRLRDLAGLTADQVGEQIGCHGSKISRIETAKRTCTLSDFRRLMELYEVDDKRRAELEELCKHGRQKTPPWWHAYGDVISANYAEFLAYEADAVESREYQTVFLPGLLQTEDYARAVTAVGFAALGPDQVDSLVEVRMARQRRLQEDDPLSITAVVTQAALRFRVGGADVQRAQLDHLLAISALDNVCLRVIPFEQGENGTYTGAFTIFSFPDEADSDVGFAESVAGSTFMDDPRDLRRLNRLFANLSRAALSAEDSLKLIEDAKKEVA